MAYINLILLCLGWPYVGCKAEDDLELLILPPLLPECWDYRHGLPHAVYVLSRSQPVVFYTLGNGFTAHPGPTASPRVRVEFLERGRH